MRPLHPRLVLLGGCVLAFGASVVNVTFLFETGTSVSHLTGDLSRIASGLATSGGILTTDVQRVLAATLGFVAGATLSGLLIHHPQLEIERPYGRMLSSMGLLFTLAGLLQATHPAVAIGIAGFACGMQNALASRYRGVVLRTTHVTGILTDLGIALGMKLRGHTIDRWKIEIPLLLAISFFIGAVVGSALHLLTTWPLLLLCGLAYVAGGLGVTIVKRLPGKSTAVA